jgi:hypothetical protein
MQRRIFWTPRMRRYRRKRSTRLRKLALRRSRELKLTGKPSEACSFCFFFEHWSRWLETKPKPLLIFRLFRLLAYTPCCFSANRQLRFLLQHDTPANCVPEVFLRQTRPLKFCAPPRCMALRRRRLRGGRGVRRAIFQHTPGLRLFDGVGSFAGR